LTLDNEELLEDLKARPDSLELEEGPLAARFFAVLGAEALFARVEEDLTVVVVVFGVDLLLLIDDKLHSAAYPNPRTSHPSAYHEAVSGSIRVVVAKVLQVCQKCSNQELCWPEGRMLRVANLSPGRPREGRTLVDRVDPGVSPLIFATEVWV
jgi:hypothetical protein